MTINASISEEIQNLSPSAIIELFIVDATEIGGDLLRFHAGTNELRGNIIWNGETYFRFPVTASGFEFTGTGQFPRPKLAVSNALSAITTVLLQTGDLLGAKVTRKRTFVKFLDEVNFADGTNPTADPSAEFPEDVYYIDRKSNEDRDLVEFELASNIDLVGVKLPRRQIVQNICTWKYRGSECGYTGAPIWDVNDIRITSATTPEGQAVLDAYAAIATARSALTTAQANLDAASAHKGTVCDYQRTDTKYEQYNRSVVQPQAPGLKYGVYIGDSGLVKGRWNGTDVPIGTVTGGVIYKIGALYKKVGTSDYYFYIERWAIDTVSCSNATTVYNNALNNRNAAKNAYDDAIADYEAAFEALPPSDPLYSRERCGKRLNSCRLRFGENNELPFGSFPASGLVR